MTGSTPPTSATRAASKRAPRAAKQPGHPAAKRQKRRQEPLDVAYRWDVTEDRLLWGRGAKMLLGAAPHQHFASGQAFAERVRGAHTLTRTHAILFSNETDDGHGVPYWVTYGFERRDGVTLWLHDSGRWFAGRDGRPAYAEGVVRRAPAPLAQDLQIASQDFVSLIERDCARLTSHSNAALMTFQLPEAEIGHNLWLDRLRAFARHGDRIGWVGRMMVLCARACPADVAQAAAHRIAESLSRDTGLPIAAFAVSVPQQARNALSALQKAEHYWAGPQGDDSTLLNRAIRALNTRSLIMAKQPIVAARSRHIMLYEGLARIPAANGHYEPTEEFIAALMAHGSITLLDHRMMSLALDALEADPKLILAVNVAPQSLAHADWFRYAEVRLSRRPDLAQRLILEITEQVDWALLRHHKAQTDAILSWGTRLALDDFGTGRTSLRHLTAMKTSLIKIAGPFVQNLTRSIEDRHCVGAMIDLARTMGLQTIAEWVEDEATAHFLEERGIDFMQGRLFGGAEPVSQLPTQALSQTRRRSAMG